MITTILNFGIEKCYATDLVSWPSDFASTTLSISGTIVGLFSTPLVLIITFIGILGALALLLNFMHKK